MVRGGNAHFLPTQEYDRGNGENRRTNQQTRTKLGVNQEQRKVCNTTCMCRLSLAWVTSENSTMLLESDSSWLTLAGPYPMLPRLSAPVSGVDRPCLWIHANLCCSPPCCPAANCLSAVQPPTASLLSSRQQPLCSPAANCPLLGRVVNSHSRPLPTSGYGEISCPRILCLVSRQNRQRNHLLW